MKDEILGFPGMTEEQAQAVLDERKRRRSWKRVPASLPKASRFDGAGLGVVKDSGVPVPKDGLRIAVIPDAQVRPGVPTDHLEWAGKYVARKQPDVIVCIGDFYDMHSLNSYSGDVRLASEQSTYVGDLDSGRRAMERFVKPIAKAKGYSPRMIYTLGNHEDRITRMALSNPRLAGLLDIKDLDLESFGWEVHPFLEPVSVGGVVFAHYLPSGVLGRPITTAREILRKLHMSAFCGHQQGKDIAFGRRADGTMMGAIISGSFYQHDEEYLSPLTNRHWRGMWMLHEVQDGSFDEMPVSMRYLERRFKRVKK